jgi:hypothetical protein
MLTRCALRSARAVCVRRLSTAPSTIEQVKAWAAANNKPEFPEEWEMPAIEDDLVHFARKTKFLIFIILFIFI